MPTYQIGMGFWIAFGLLSVATAGLFVVIWRLGQGLDHGLLDTCMTRTALLGKLDAYRADTRQRAIHEEITKVYDTLFPPVYGAFGILIAWRCGGEQARLIAVLIVTGVLADFVENALTLKLLAGGDAGIGRHLLATRIKFLALATAALLFFTA